MSAFSWAAPGVTTWDDGDEVVLYSGFTGRSLRVHRDTITRLNQDPRAASLAPLRRRLAELHLIVGDAPLGSALIPVRSRMVLFLPDEATLWCPVPGYRGPGGYGYRAYLLSPAAYQFWRAVNDARTLAQVAEVAGLTLIAAQAIAATLCGPDLQLLQLRPEPPRARDSGLERIVDLPRPPNSRPPHLTGPYGETTLTWYHLHEISDGSSHFDNRETTFAHAFAEPHPGLGGRRYGEALVDALRTAGHLPAPTGLWVEVGCGTGELARDALAASNHPRSRYLRLDLSPELLRTQARNAPGTPGILADAVALPVADASVDLLVSNEVIADLQAVPVDPADPQGEAAFEALAWAERAGIPLTRGWVNLGAWRFVSEIARALRPGGAAWLSEFGTIDGPPEEASHLDHPEVSIQAEHLVAIARHAGLIAQVEPLADALRLDLRATWLSRPSWHAARALAASRGTSLPARAWTSATLQAALPFPVHGLRDASLADEGPGPLVTRFFAWTLRKPA